MTCPTCGAENVAGSKFCNECGTPLAAACPTCGTVNQPGSKFCRECGTVLGGGPAQATRPASGGGAPIAPRHADAAPVAERRLVSVLFADLVGFTTLAEGRDPEETRELLTRYFDLAREVVERYGGVVEKFIGDAVMAVWGAPIAREDDAERAVRAGLDLVSSVRSLGPDLQARAGVLTGEAAVTIGATNQGMVAGDIVNTASRLQSAAAPGTVLVGEATARAADRAIAFEPAGEQHLKGKAAPVPAWRALRVVAERGGRNRAETLEAPFVGRDDELRLLKDLYHATSREGRARLVSVIGPAGIGKSRLAWEFLKYIDGLVEDVWWHDGRSPAYGDGITFWALGEMVRRRAGLRETDDEATTRTRIVEMLAEHVPDADERKWIEPALLALLGVEADVRSEQLFGAWRTFFERLSASGPVVLAFEDLHFADAGLLDFIDHLLEWSRSSPIYVLTLARPELLEKRPDWGAGKRNFVSVYLEPLPEPSMRELLAGLVPGLPDRTARAIVARADGIPLYAVETVRMLVAEGRLRLQGDRYVPIGDLAELAIPETLTALIAARLDGLAPEDRALVSDAAVLGQSFTLAGLAAVSGAAETDLEPRLRALVRRELLTMDADPRSPEQGQYAFVQALIREVAYNTLAKRDRQVRHLAAARFFEALGSDELAGALAGHYLAAYESAGAGVEADALAAQARIALRAAADRAVGLGSYDQALRFLTQALTVTTETAERAELMERAGVAASTLARHEEAEALLRAAIELWRETGDRPKVALATARLGRALIDIWRTDAARVLLEPAAEEFADLGGEPAVAVLGQLARDHVMLGDHRRAIEVCDRTLALAEPIDAVDVIADTLVTKGSALANLGHGYEGMGAIRIGIEIASEHGLTETWFRGRNNLGGYLSARDPVAAVRLLREGMEEARRLGVRSWLIFLAQNATESAKNTGDWDWALAELDTLLGTDLEPVDRVVLLGQVVAFGATRGQPIETEMDELERITSTLKGEALGQLLTGARAVVAFGEGRLQEARGSLLEMAAMSPMNAPQVLQDAAHVATWLGDGSAVAADIAALDATGAHGRAIAARRRGMEAAVLAFEGRTADALAAYRDAFRQLDDLGMVWDRALVGIDMATLLDPGLPEVQAAAAAAREILERLGARPYLERLEAAMAKPAEASDAPAAWTAAERAASSAEQAPA